MKAGALAGDQSKAQKEARAIVLIDESGLSERPHWRPTWAPRGLTPHNVTLTGDAVGDSWGDLLELLLSLVSRSHPQSQIIELLSHLLRHIPGKLLMVWDNRRDIAAASPGSSFASSAAACGWSFSRLP